MGIDIRFRYRKCGSFDTAVGGQVVFIFSLLLLNLFSAVSCTKSSKVCITSYLVSASWRHTPAATFTFCIDLS
jgi:hypothetical protein